MKIHWNIYEIINICTKIVGSLDKQQVIKFLVLKYMVVSLNSSSEVSLTLYLSLTTKLDAMFTGQGRPLQLGDLNQPNSQLYLIRLSSGPTQTNPFILGVVWYR